ncbi:hypothetical protein [Cupriavidus basilensis]|uniref:hypothetical protein n=1 Tax=Cupriavidus basilensis TaxID=68895 RepID=UPI0011469870|nr:hypothetical protein [Cupriavidus basilensis]
MTLDWQTRGEFQRIRVMHAPWCAAGSVNRPTFTVGPDPDFRGAYTVQGGPFGPAYTSIPLLKSIRLAVVNRGTAGEFPLLKKEAFPEAAFQPFVFGLVGFAHR